MNAAKAATTNQAKQNEIGTKDNLYGTIRVKPVVKEKAAKLLAKVKQNCGGKRYTIGDMLEYLIDSVSAQQIEEMHSKTVSHMDKFFAAYEEQKKRKPNLSKDEFFQLVMEGKFRFSRGKQ